MSNKITPNERLQHLQDYNRRLIRSQKDHSIRLLCQNSNWPFTGDLTPQEIVCMQDTYCGNRRTLSCLPRQSDYDAYHYPTVGWNQWAPRDTREHVKDCQKSAKLEDGHRTVVVCANSTYGHYIDRFIDFTAGDHGRHFVCKRQFYKHNPISTLPPIKNLKLNGS